MDEIPCEYCDQAIELVNHGWEHVEFNPDCWAALPSSKPTKREVPELDLGDSYLSDLMKKAFG